MHQRAFSKTLALSLVCLGLTFPPKHESERTGHQDTNDTYGHWGLPAINRNLCPAHKPPKVRGSHKREDDSTSHMYWFHELISFCQMLFPTCRDSGTDRDRQALAVYTLWRQQPNHSRFTGLLQITKLAFCDQIFSEDFSADLFSDFQCLNVPNSHMIQHWELALVSAATRRQQRSLI